MLLKDVTTINVVEQSVQKQEQSVHVMKECLEDVHLGPAGNIVKEKFAICAIKKLLVPATTVVVVLALLHLLLDTVAQIQTIFVLQILKLPLVHISTVVPTHVL
jgi:hypothetical protein